jgi:hypothetical protein
MIRCYHFVIESNTKSELKAHFISGQSSWTMMLKVAIDQHVDSDFHDHILQDEPASVLVCPIIHFLRIHLRVIWGPRASAPRAAWFGPR